MARLSSTRFLLIQHPDTAQVEIVEIIDSDEAISPAVGIKYNPDSIDGCLVTKERLKEKLIEYYGECDEEDLDQLDQYGEVIHVFEDGINNSFSALERLMGNGEVERCLLQPLINACLTQGSGEEKLVSSEKDRGEDEEKVYTSVPFCKFLLIRKDNGYVKIVAIDEKAQPVPPAVGQKYDEDRSDELAPNGTLDEVRERGYEACDGDDPTEEDFTNFPTVIYVFDNTLSMHYSALANLLGEEVERDWSRGSRGIYLLQCVVDACLKQATEWEVHYFPFPSW